MTQTNLRSNRLAQSSERTSSAPKNEWWIMNQPKSGTAIFKLNKQDTFTRQLWQLGTTFISFILITVERTPVFTAHLLNSCSSLSRTINRQRTEWDQCVSKLSAEVKLLHFTAMWAKSEALACFLHGHNAKQVSSQRGWHADRPSRQETADDEGLGLGHVGARSRLGRAVSGAVLRHIPAAWRTGRKIPNVK